MKRLTGLPLCLLVLALLLPTPLWAAAGKVVIAAGDVFAVNAQNQRRLLQRRDNVFEGDTLITGTDSNLQLRLEDNAILALRANSQLRISDYQSQGVILELLSGGFRTIGGRFSTADQASYRVRTPTASVRIHSAHYEVVFATPTLTVGVYEGSLTATNALGTIDLGLDNDFLYAQLASGQLPLGLLDPPATLLAASTPGTGATTQPGDSASGDEDLSDLNNGNSQAPSNDPDNTALPIPDADAISDGDFDFSALEDGFEEQVDTQDPNSVMALSNSEVNALKGDTLVTDIMALAPSDSPSSQDPIIAHGAQVGGNTIGNIYVAYVAQTGLELDDGFYLPNLAIRPDGSASTDADSVGGGFSVESDGSGDAYGVFTMDSNSVPDKFQPNLYPEHDVTLPPTKNQGKPAQFIRA